MKKLEKYQLVVKENGKRIDLYVDNKGMLFFTLNNTWVYLNDVNMNYFYISEVQ